MALLLRKMYHAYFWIFNDLADHRSDHLPLLPSPLTPIAILCGYLYFVYKLGPKLMENRKPFELKNIMRVYNILQVVLNLYVFVKSVRVFTKASLHCHTIDYSNSPEGLNELGIAYFYYLLKLLDLLDTVFFVLRKSYRQISFLHTYHHCGMVAGVWVAARFFPGGNGAWVTAINGLIHVLLYAYYFLSTVNDKWKNNLTLKKSITQMQLIQFTMLIFLFGRVFFQPQCDYPRLVSFVFVPQNVFMFMLFGEFYFKSYVFNKKKSVTNETKTS